MHSQIHKSIMLQSTTNSSFYVGRRPKIIEIKDDTYLKLRILSSATEKYIVLDEFQFYGISSLCRYAIKRNDLLCLK